MAIHVDEDNLKQGLLGLVIALVEVVRDVLRLQAVERVDGGRLTEEEVDRLGRALMDLDEALEAIKEEHGINGSVQAVRDGLDETVGDVVDRLVNPARWGEQEETTR
jgi:hypothetical protein